VRVHEELVASGAALSYPALTAFCRREGIGQEPVVPAGSYDHFSNQARSCARHLTAARVTMGGRKFKAELATVLCCSRMLFFESGLRSRNDCKVFLTKHCAICSSPNG
jgi:hypothetical protein